MRSSASRIASAVESSAGAHDALEREAQILRETRRAAVDHLVLAEHFHPPESSADCGRTASTGLSTLSANLVSRRTYFESEEVWLAKTISAPQPCF
jgi:hypothetical protein